MHSIFLASGQGFQQKYLGQNISGLKQQVSLSQSSLGNSMFLSDRNRCWMILFEDHRPWCYGTYSHKRCLEQQVNTKLFLFWAFGLHVEGQQQASCNHLRILFKQTQFDQNATDEMMKFSKWLPGAYNHQILHGQCPLWHQFCFQWSCGKKKQLHTWKLSKNMVYLCLHPLRPLQGGAVRKI